MCLLADLFKEGRGVPQSDVEAVRWWKKAADYGDMQAQFYLGAQYLQGTGVAQSYVEAARWTEKAAAQGCIDAQYK